MDPMLAVGGLFAAVALGVLVFASRRQGRGRGNNDANTWGDGGSNVSGSSDNQCDTGSNAGGCDGGGSDGGGGGGGD